MISKTETVLELDPTAHAARFRPEDWAHPTSVKQIVLTREMHEEMGWPDTITVTIRPGDRLNQ